MGRAKTKPRSMTPGWVVYGRTSDEDAQAPERSLASQRRLCSERLIDGSGLACLDEYTDIFSGRSTDRKNYQRLLTDARDGKFSHVAVAFVDRFGRNDVEGIRAFDELTKLGIKVRIATYPSLDPAMADGRMIVTMLFGVAQFEAARISERCREGMHSKLLGGDWAWRAPDGYVNREERLTSTNVDDKLKHARYKRWVEIDPEQSKVWREAWDMLLTDTMSLRDICEALHSKGNRSYPINIMARIFHNWFYAGWVVIDTDWATIAPKTVRGNWTPVVSTEEFETGIAILAKRTQIKDHKRKHFYLLQRLIFLEKRDGSLVKLGCSTPNANREDGGSPYYCIQGTSMNFLCRQIDRQIPGWIHNIQVNSSDLAPIRALYVQQLHSLIKKPNSDERSMLEKALKDLAEEELRCARLHAKQQISDDVWATLWNEWQDQRNMMKANLEAMDRNCETHITTLDDALNLIAKAGILFDKLPQGDQQELLRHLVKRVVINPEGQILRLDLQTPFSYLYELMKTMKELPNPKEARYGSRTRKRTSRHLSTCSVHVPPGSSACRMPTPSQILCSVDVPPGCQ